MSLNSDITNLILEKGRAQAQGITGSGQAWGSALSQIGQNVGQTIQNIPKIQEQAARSADEQRARDARNALSEAMKTVPPVKQDGLSLYDVQGIGTAMAQKGYGPEFAAAAGHLDTINQSTIGFQQGRLGLIKSGAASLAATGADPTLTNDFLEHLKGNQVYSDQTIQSWQDRIKSEPEAAAKIVAYLAGPQKAVVLKEGEQGFDPLTNKPVPGLAVAPKPVVLKPGEQGFNPVTNQPVPGLNVPERPVILKPGEQGFDPATNQPIEGLNVPAPEKPPRPIEEQLLEAIANGDKPKADQIKQTLHDAAIARRDPAATALANELGGLRKDEAQARLDAMKKKAEPLDISPDVQTTGAGRRYVDMSGYSAEQRDKAREAANANGVVPISKEQANALQEIDNARMNQKSIITQVQDLLPKDPTGRVLQSPGIKLSKLFQTDEQIAAYNSWRTAAIQTLRATAGSKGLRINQAEIAQAIENDIPKLTDTLGTAKQKFENINTLLENAEKSILVRDRSEAPKNVATALKGASAGRHTLSDGSVWIVGSDGSVIKGS